MGKYKCLLENPRLIVKFRAAYHIPLNVDFRLLGPDDPVLGSPDSAVLPVVSIVEGGVRFPLDPLLLNFVYRQRLAPTQISVNTFRIINSIAELARKENLPLGLDEVLHCYQVIPLGSQNTYYLRANKGRKLITGLPPKDKCPEDWLRITGEYERIGEPSLPWRESMPGISSKKKKYVSRDTLAAVQTALALPEELRSAPYLLNYIPSYERTTQPKRRGHSSLTGFLYEDSPPFDLSNFPSDQTPQSPSGEPSSPSIPPLSPIPEPLSPLPIHYLTNSPDMPRKQPDINLVVLALEGGITQKTPRQPTAEPLITPDEAATVAPSPQAQPETHRRKRSRDQSSGREGRGKEREGRGKDPESLPESVWQPIFSYKGKPIPEDMSLDDNPRLAAELASALLLPKDVETVQNTDKRKLTRSIIHLHAMALQRTYVALSGLENEAKDYEAMKQQNAELLLELNKSKEAQTKAEDARMEAEIGRREAEIGRRNAEEETLSAKAQTFEVEQSLADREQELAEIKLRQQDREDAAYNEGVNDTTEIYKGQILEAREALFAKGWTSAMKKAGVPEDSSLFNVENPYEHCATTPLSPSASQATTFHLQDPPAPLE